MVIEIVYQVTAKVLINDKGSATTYTSTEGWDECHRKIERHIKSNSKAGDKVVTDIINTTTNTYRHDF